MLGKRERNTYFAYIKTISILDLIMRLLIISPSFLPNNTPDLHRTRISIPWFQKAGHEVTVISVDPQYVEAPVDGVFSQLPDPCRVIRIKAFNSKVTRKFGLGNLGYRCLFQLNYAVNQLLKKEKFDLIYFSTTVFPVMILGRRWKTKFNIPFVLDMQDPWRNDFYLTQPKQNRPPKFRIAHFLDSVLERYTIPHCNGIIAVSDAYPKTLNQRYKTNIPSSTIPFSATKSDFDLAEKMDVKNSVFKKQENTVHLIYTGAITPGMPLPLRLMLKAIKNIQDEFKNIQIKTLFIGTSYAEAGHGKYKAIPIAEELGMKHMVTEYPERFGYFETIRLMQDADVLLLPGSMEAGYTASKIYPYILSQKPILALTHVLSSVSFILNGCNTGPIITFSTELDLAKRQKEVEEALVLLLTNLPQKADINWDFYRIYSDEVMAQRQISFFKTILNEG